MRVLVNKKLSQQQDNRVSPAAVTDRTGRPLRDLRVSLTDACNFLCTYCMPEELFGDGYPFLSHRSLLTFDEIVTLVRHMAKLGVQKVKITGGEPLLRPGVHRLYQAGLRRVTVSLDSIVPETFDHIVGRAGGLSRVIDGIRTARSVGFDPVEINMVVQRGINDHEAVRMAEFARAEGAELRYIEYMDVGRCNTFEESLLVPNSEIRDRLHYTYPVRPLDPDYYGDVANTYEYLDGAGRVGFIPNVTQPFCGTCTRLRVSADGKLYRCLFSGIGMDARAIWRDGSLDETERTIKVDQAVRRFWGIREDRYSERRAEEGPLPGSTRPERVEMYRMGGS